MSERMERQTGESSSSAVKVSKLVKRYGDMLALDYFDLDVHQGEIFGLLGPNGSGKTTAINCILALLTFDEGTVRVFDEPIGPTSYALKRRIGIVPQNVAVFNELTVEENIDYFCSLYVPDRARRHALVEDALDFVGLRDYRRFRPSKLSVGLLRRLNIACGVAHKPDLIFFDEPTVAVDPQSRNAILEGIQPVNRIESAQDIQTWFTGYGLEVDGASITADKVKIPRRWDDSFSAFNGVVQQSGMDLARYKGKTVEKWSALLPAASSGETSRYGVLLVYKKKAVGAYLLEKPSGTVLGLQDAQNELAKQTSGEDYSGDWGERHDEQLTDSTAQQTSGEPETEPEAAPQAAPYTELPLDAEGYPVE